MIFTKHEVVPVELNLWAIPLNEYEKEDYPEGTLFRYTLYNTDNQPWREGAVMVQTQYHSFEVPAGVNLYEKAMETLETAKADVYKEAARQADRIQEKIDSLKLIAAPAPKDVQEIVE